MMRQTRHIDSERRRDLELLGAHPIPVTHCWLYGGEAMDRQRRYRVSGVDEYGDVYALETDDAEHAEQTRKQFGEDLTAVGIEDRGGA